MSKQTRSFKNLMQDVVQNQDSFANLEEKVRNAAQQSDFQVFVKDAKDDEPAELYLMGTIGDGFSGISAKDVTEFCRENRGRPIHAMMDSGGGDVFDGMTIMNALLRHDAEVTGEIMGLCYSAASYAILGCDTVSAHETSNFGIHPAWTIAMGNQYQMRDAIKWLEEIDGLITNVYGKRTGLSEDEIMELFLGDDNDGTIMKAERAYELGFVDQLIPLPERKPRKQDDETDDADDETAESPDQPDDGQDTGNTAGVRPRGEAVDPQQDLDDVRQHQQRIKAKHRAFRRRQWLQQEKKRLKEAEAVN